MTSLDPPSRPPRHSRAFWADARFLLGIVLIVGSVAGVWAVVAASSRTAPVLAASHTLVPGTVIGEADVDVVDATLGPATDQYLRPGALEPGAVVTRVVGRGELIAAAAIESGSAARSTTVVISTAGGVPAEVAVGTTVEIWASPLRDRGEYDTPRVLVPSASVRSVARGESVIGGDETSVEVVVPRSDVADLLEAIAGSWSLSVVPATATAP